MKISYSNLFKLVDTNITFALYFSRPRHDGSGAKDVEGNHLADTYNMLNKFLMDNFNTRSCSLAAASIRAFKSLIIHGATDHVALYDDKCAPLIGQDLVMESFFRWFADHRHGTSFRFTVSDSSLGKRFIMHISNPSFEGHTVELSLTVPSFLKKEGVILLLDDIESKCSGGNHDFKSDWVESLGSTLSLLEASAHN